MTRESDAGSRPTSWQASSTRVLRASHRGEVVLAVGVPGVGVAGGETEHALTAAADEDGRSLGTRAARAQLAVAGGVVGALEVDVPGAQQGGDDLQRLLEAADAVVVGEAEGGVFGLVPAGAETEDQAGRRRSRRWCRPSWR